MVELITPAEFARRQGVTPQAVHRAIKRGRLTQLPGGKLDPAVAGIQWQENRQRAANGTRTQSTKAAPPPSDSGAVPSLEASKRRQAFHEANLAEMRERQKAGELVEVRGVQLAYTTLAAQLRAALERLPYVLATRLAAESDQDRVFKLLESEIDAALRDMSRMASEIPDRLTESAKDSI